MREKKYASDISREKFAEIEPLLVSVRRRTKPTTVDLYEVFCAVLYVLRTGCQWRFLPSEFPKWQTVYAYFAKWSKPDEHDISVLERALKKSGWRGPRETDAQRHAHTIDCGRAEREEHGHSRARVMTRARKSRASSATLQWTRRGCPMPLPLPLPK